MNLKEAYWFANKKSSVFTPSAKSSKAGHWLSPK
jgi:hypothetical protein